MWEWIHDPAHEVNALLAVDSAQRVLALAHYRTFARPLTASTGCFLDDLYVEEETARGGGAADALLHHLRDLARERGWTVTRWITARDNGRAQACYARHAARTSWITYDMT